MFTPSLAHNLRKAISTVFYDGRVVPRHTEDKHFYEDTVDKEIYPSVTARTGIIDKPFLKQWAANQAVESLEQFLLENKDYEPVDLVMALKSAKSAHKRSLDKASSWGTQAHEIVDEYVRLWITGKRLDNIRHLAPEGTSPEAISAILGAEKFFNSYNLFPIVSEKLVLSKKNKYGGTLDTLFLIGKKSNNTCVHEWHDDNDETYIKCSKCGEREKLNILLLDLKTSNTIYDHKDYPCQVSAYSMALTEMVDIKPSLHWILQLNKKRPDYEVAVIKDIESAGRGFLLMNQLSQYIEDNDEPMEPLKKKNVIKL